MTPEETARREIDAQLSRCGWIVQDYRRMNISAGPGVAIREFPLSTGEADYLLYLDAKAVGVVEAKPEGHSLTGVETQSGKYLDGLPANMPNYRLPLPFGYPLFDPIVKPSKASERYYIHGKDAEASGELVEDGFVVHRGALGRAEIVPSAMDVVPSLRQPLYEAGVIVKEDSRIRFTQDHLFRTPSGAAAAVLGRTSNGWVDWKNEGGEPLDQIRKAESTDEQ